MKKKFFEKDFFKLIHNGLFGKILENIRNRLKVEFIKNCENTKFFEQQSKLTFNGIHKLYTNYNSYTFKHYEVLMDKPIYVGFAITELNKLHMYES